MIIKKYFVNCFAFFITVGDFLEPNMESDGETSLKAEDGVRFSTILVNCLNCKDVLNSQLSYSIPARPK